MSCTYTYQGKTYNAWEFADVLASVPLKELIKHLPEEAVNQLAMASPGYNEVDEYGDPLPEVAKFIHQGIQGKNPIEVAAWLEQKAPRQYSEIARYVREKLESMHAMGIDFGMEIVTAGDMGHVDQLSARGATYPVQDKDGNVKVVVSVNGSDMKGRVGTSFRTVTHELIHAATMQSIRLGEMGVPQYKDAAKDLMAVLLHVGNTIVDNIKNGTANDFEISVASKRRNMLDNPGEIVAWALSSHEAQAYLDSVKYQGKSAWTKFVEAIRKVFGLNASADSALSEVLRVSEILLKPSKLEDIFGIQGDPNYEIDEYVPPSFDGVDRRQQQPGSGSNVFKGDSTSPNVAWSSENTIPETITVDGVELPTRNSNGKPIYPTEEGIRNFWRWFSGSRVVDEQGRPLVMYHGTEWNAFGEKEGDTSFNVNSRGGVFFTESKLVAGGFGKNVMEVYLSIKNPEYEDFEGANLYGSMLIGKQRSGMPTISSVIGIAHQKGKDGVYAENIVPLVSKIPNSKQEIDEITSNWVVAFYPTQIKSATDNNGDFDGANPSIQSSISFSPNDYRERLQNSDSLIANKIGNFIEKLTGESASKFGFLHKTIASQFQKARKNQHFGRVYSSAQQYIEDIARYATEAADLAPGIIPKIDGIKDAFNDIRNSKQGKQDQAKIAKPIFEGTLDYMRDDQGQLRKTDNVDEAGVVFSDSELQSIFGLNDRQIDLYRQFRIAINDSLETMAISEMNKVAKANGFYMSSEDMNMWQTANFFRKQYADELKDLRTQYDERLKVYEATEKEMRRNAGKPGMKLSYAEYTDTMNKLKSQFEAEHRTIFNQIERLENLDKAFTGRAETVDNMKKKGYAPLSRFGKYTVDAVKKVPKLDADARPVIDKETGEPITVNERIFFSMYESEQEAREAQRALEAEYPDALVSRGIMSQDGYQLFGSVNPGTLEALKEMIGGEDKIMQEYYTNAVSSRSALKRLIHRQGIKGYSEDVTRTLASFLLSNARATAAADHFGDMVEAAAAIPKSQGDVLDEAVKLINYIRNPNEEAGFARGLLFIQFLGGSVASAAVNLTQSMTTTLPFLHQYGGKVGDLISAGKIAAQRMRGKNVLQDQELAKALRLAEEEGVVSPHNIHVLMGQSGMQSATNSRGMRLFNQVWGSFFGMAEQFNRETSFIAAYQLAKKIGQSGLNKLYDEQAKLHREKGLAAPDRKIFSNPFEFAKNAVNETQFVMSKAARPNWARGSIGATLFTFQQFKVFYMELFSRLPRKEQAIMLGVLIMMAGLSGLPFEDDLEDLIDTLGQAMGYKTNTEKWKTEILTDFLGPVGKFANEGVSSFMPFDIANRMGMGNLIPSTGLLKKSNSGNHERDIQEALGAAGGMFKQLTDAWDYTLKGEYLKAVTYAAAPKAIKDAAKGYDMATTGVYEDTKGRRVTDVSMSDAFWKAIGFQPTAVSSIQKIKGFEMQDINLVKNVKASIAEIWAEGIHDRDADKTAQARSMIDEWNEKNPEAKIKIDRASVQRRVKQMGVTAQERFEKTAPKEMRKQVREAFSQ